jgi:hypothetical protein
VLARSPSDSASALLVFEQAILAVTDQVGNAWHVVGRPAY